MVRRFAWIAAGGFRAGAAAAAATLALVCLAYQLPASLDADLGSSWSGALVARGFYEPEGPYRWSRGVSELVFPDPGQTRSARLELTLSGFRPRGTDTPNVLLEAGDAGGQSHRITPSRRIESYAFETETVGRWSSTLTVRLRSDVFSPGAGDERALGVRLHRARLLVRGPAAPPARQLLAALALVLLLFTSVRSRRARVASALGLAVALAVGYGWARLPTAFFAPGVAVGLSILVVASQLLPSAARFLRDVTTRSALALRVGAVALATRWAAALTACAVVGAVLAYGLRPSFDVDLGSGRADLIASRFTGYDRAEDGTTFRRPLPDATLDLRDFGWGSPWTLSVRASVERVSPLSPVTEVLVRTSEEDFAADLSRDWGTYRFDLPDPGRSWRAGRTLTFPGLGRGGGEEAALEIASVRVDRGVSFPSIHALALVVASSLLLAAAFAAAGLSPRAASAGGALLALLVDYGIYVEPVIVTPALGRALLAGGTALLGACCARGWIAALAERDLVPELAPGALAVAVSGLVIWFLETASPLYVGGHFVYHTSIAEEIWRGKFFLYYFPGPDNMLSHQPQWGNLVVPHPSFYHTVAAPFAALPHEGFYLATKAFLALLLFGLTLSAALMATSSAGTPRAGVYAAAVSAGAPTGSQLLGLGHLMTIFGAFGAAVGLGFVVIQERRLSRRREWLIGVGLITLCFLSYTGSLLFGSVTLAMSVLWLYRSERTLALRLATLLLAGWGLALLLYYMHWVVPFLTDSLPQLAGKGSSGTVDLGARLRLAPEKLSYTFGSWLVAAFGLAGLGLARSRARRVLLGSWGSVLILFSGLDLYFNFLLKHHYFSLPAVAVGAALALHWLEGKKTPGRLLLAAFVVFLWMMGLEEALRVAAGGV
jgi:hypothetical protein